MRYQFFNQNRKATFNFTKYVENRAINGLPIDLMYAPLDGEVVVVKGYASGVLVGKSNEFCKSIIKSVLPEWCDTCEEWPVAFNLIDKDSTNTFIFNSAKFTKHMLTYEYEDFNFADNAFFNEMDGCPVISGDFGLYFMYGDAKVAVKPDWCDEISNMDKRYKDGRS